MLSRPARQRQTAPARRSSFAKHRSYDRISRILHAVLKIVRLDVVAKAGALGIGRCHGLHNLVTKTCPGGGGRAPGRPLGCRVRTETQGKRCCRDSELNPAIGFPRAAFGETNGTARLRSTFAVTSAGTSEGLDFAPRCELGACHQKVDRLLDGPALSR